MMKKDGWKSFRTDKTDRARLVALKKAHIGTSDGDRLSLGLACLVKKHRVEVPA